MYDAFVPRAPWAFAPRSTRPYGVLVVLRHFGILFRDEELEDDGDGDSDDDDYGDGFRGSGGDE